MKQEGFVLGVKEERNLICRSNIYCSEAQLSYVRWSLVILPALRAWPWRSVKVMGISTADSMIKVYDDELHRDTDSYNGRLIGSHIEWHQHQWPWVTLKFTFAVWNLSNSHTTGNIERDSYDVYTLIGECTSTVTSCLVETEGRFTVTGSFMKLHEVVCPPEGGHPSRRPRIELATI